MAVPGVWGLVAEPLRGIRQNSPKSASGGCPTHGCVANGCVCPHAVHSHNDFLLAILTRCQILVSAPGESHGAPSEVIGLQGVSTWVWGKVLRFSEP